jgi:hypothetical protein
MATLGEIFRFLTITLGVVRDRLYRRYRRLTARLLGRDQLVAGTERKFRALMESAPDASSRPRSASGRCAPPRGCSSRA